MKDNRIKLSNDNFIDGDDSFDDLEIHPTPIDNFYCFFNKKDNKLIKQFILNKKDKVDYICIVKLIKKDKKFTPRLAISIRNITEKIIEESINATETLKLLIKTNINLIQCQQNLYKLISFLTS